MKSKKILILGSKENFSLERMYDRAFKLIGAKVYFLHIYDIKKTIIFKLIWKFLRFIIFYNIRKKIIKRLENNKIKYDLIVIFKGLYINEEFLSSIKKIQPEAKIINIFTDDPFDISYFKDISNKNILRCINYFDYLFIFSKEILKKLEKKFPKKKFNYLPFGSDNKIHKKYLNNSKKKFDLSFTGTADQQRFNYINYLKEFKIILAGSDWEKFKLSKNIKYIGKIDAKRCSKIMRQSIVSLNILRPQNKFSHNMKTFEIPAMGGLMITNRNVEQNKFFQENHGCLMYGNKEELKLKIKMVLKNPKKFNKIKQNGYRVSKRHFYKERARKILNITFDK